LTPSNVDENDALYRRIRSGDQSAVAEMIERNMPLVRSRVGAFLKDYRRFRHLFDDLIGVGSLALTGVVNSFATTDVEKPTGYIVAEIKHALTNYVDTEIGAGMMTSRTVQRRRKRNEPIPAQLPFDPAEPPAYLWGGELPPKVSQDDANEISGQYAVVGDTAQELLSEILGCCRTDDERAIVKLRRDGLTDAEIGKQLGVSRATVGRHRHEIERRLNQRNR
jgi:RNA polymerase sigma factor (sigma-70 family)